MSEYYKNTNSVSLDAVHKLIEFYEKFKEIKIGETYWVSEWSHSPIYDGILAYEETIRNHMIVNGIDVYFTNKNYRIYLKEDLYETKERCEEICSWKNSFAYDYECYIDRKIKIKKLLENKTINDNVIWNLKIK